MLTAARLAYLSVQGVQQRVPRPVGHTAAAVGLASLAIVQALPAKGTLVYTSVLTTAERHPIVLKLV